MPQRVDRCAICLLIVSAAIAPQTTASRKVQLHLACFATLFLEAFMVKHHTAFGAAIAVLLTALSAGAQQPTARAPGRVPATVALVDNLPVSGVSFVVQRRPGRTPTDLILLRKSATAAELSDAVRTLATARSAGGDYPMEGATVRMRAHQKSEIRRMELPWTRAVLARLHRAKPRTVEGVGTVPAVAIWLPRQVPRGGQVGGSKRSH
jgi:hypothetical protein